MDENRAPVKRVARVAVSGAAFTIDKLYDYIVPEPMRAALRPGMRVSVPFSRSNRHVEGVVMELAETSDYEKLKPLDCLLDEAPVLSEMHLMLAKWMKSRFFCTTFEAMKAMLPAGLWFKKEYICSIADGVDRAAAFDAAGEDPLAKGIIEHLFSLGGSGDLSQLGEVFGDNGNVVLKKLISLGILKSGMKAKRRASDKMAEYASLAVSCEEAIELAENKRRAAAQQASVLRLLTEIGEADTKEISYFTGASIRTIRSLEKAGFIKIEKREVFRLPKLKKSDKPSVVALNDEQQAAYDGLKGLMEKAEAAAALLYGVTGSGKTSVYIKLIKRAIELGGQAIVLVPEIALTPQLMSVFSAYFGDRVALLHSSLSINERYDEWKKIRSGGADLVVGTRSAIFAPLDRIRLVILDEEQEAAYKSENSPRYDAKEIAKYICVHEKALLLLGSATPSVESMYNAKLGKYKLFTINTRYNTRALPEVLIADMKENVQEGGGTLLSGVLMRELEKNIAAGEQTILFINRRGANSSVACPECGYTFECPSCSAKLTYHSANRRMMCHYCGYSQPSEEECPECGSRLDYIGAGTQRVEDELGKLFPGVPILRMDTDTVTAARSHEIILNEFAEKKIPILIGTQMVAKGLDFENVTLVGVLSADQMIYAGDYRARERAFSLITQVVGRSGRGEKTGRAVIQTYTPENEVIRFAARQDYASFFESEAKLRNVLRLPPFSELYSIMVTGADEDIVLRCCCEMKTALEKSVTPEMDARVLGPASAHILKVNNRFRYRVYLRCAPGREARALIAAAIKRYSKEKRFRGISVFGDVDPAD